WAHGAIPAPLVHGAPGLTSGPAIAVLEPERELGALDPDLLGDLAPRALVVGFAGAAHATGEHVVGAGMDVLGRGAAMHQHRARGVFEQHVRAAMEEAPLAHLAARDRGDHAIVLVHDVDELVSGIHGHALRGAEDGNAIDSLSPKLRAR